MEASDHHNSRASTFGSLVKRDREQAGLSLTAYAVMVGISRPYLSRLERGEHARPSPRVVAQIARRRGLSMADLFFATDYLFPDDLPSFGSYVRAKCQGWPESAIKELEDFYLYIEAKYSLK